MKKLSNTEAELQKNVGYKKSVYQLLAISYFRKTLHPRRSTGFLPNTSLSSWIDQTIT